MFSHFVSIHLLTFLIFPANSFALSGTTEIYCNIKGGNLGCQTTGPTRRVMNADDISKFIDAAEVKAYITLKSRKGTERTFLIDGKSAPFKRLAEVKNSAVISELASAKTSLFHDIEKKVIKLSDELDGQASAAEFVLWDPGITYEKASRENRELQTEVEGYRKNKDTVCTSTPAFEAISKSNSRLQQTLSNVVFAWQTPGTCMNSYKIFKDNDGSVDLRQLDSATEHYKKNCKAQ